MGYIYLPFRGRERCRYPGVSIGTRWGGWLTGWNYRKQFLLSRASGAVTNYQVKLLLGESSGATGEDVDCGGLCLTSFNDIRFTTGDGKTLLDYWIESISGTTPNQLATIWIELDSIGTGATTFYMYYGNLGAAAVSSGPNTFLLFDHFADSSVDAALWDTSGTVAESGTVATIGTGSSYLRSKSAFGTAIALRGYAKASGGDNDNICSLTDDDYSEVADWNRSIAANFNCCTAKGGVSHDTSSGVIKDYNYHIFDICRNGTTSILFYLDGGLKVTESNPTYITGADMKILHRTYAASVSQTIVDWVLIRQWLATEPAWGSWGAQESVV